MPVRERVGFGPQAHRALVPLGSVIICVHPNTHHIDPAEHQAWGMERKGRGNRRPPGSEASLGQAVGAGKWGMDLGFEGPELQLQDFGV